MDSRRGDPPDVRARGDERSPTTRLSSTALAPRADFRVPVNDLAGAAKRIALPS